LSQDVYNNIFKDLFHKGLAELYVYFTIFTPITYTTTNRLYCCICKEQEENNLRRTWGTTRIILLNCDAADAVIQPVCLNLSTKTQQIALDARRGRQNFGSRTWGTVTKILPPGNEADEVMCCVLAVWGYVVVIDKEFRNLHKRLCQSL